MKKFKYLSVLVTSMLLVMLSTSTVFANSSWHWVTDTAPINLLPFVAIGTLIIETLAINIIPKINKPLKVFAVVAIANLLSFLMPYILLAGEPPYYSIKAAFRCPFYTVGLVFLFMTLAVELPVVYFTLRKKVENKKRLLLVIIGSNVVTTVLVAIVERVLCYGRW